MSRPQRAAAVGPGPRSFGLMAPHKHVGVKNPAVARTLLKAIHPAL